MEQSFKLKLLGSPLPGAYACLININFSPSSSLSINFLFKSALIEEVKDINIIKRNLKISYMDIRLDNLNKTIVNCKKCPRLVKFVHKVSTQKENKIGMKFTGANLCLALEILILN